MKISTSAAAPLLFAVTMLAAGALAATQANAADARLTDVGFVNAARCAGVAQAAGFDNAAHERMLDRQSASREPLALIMAESARDEGQRIARQGGYWRAQASNACKASDRALLDTRGNDAPSGR